MAVNNESLSNRGTNICYRNDGEAFVVMENQLFTPNHNDWCAIGSTFVVSCFLCIAGIFLIVYRDVSSGIIFLFVGGTVLVLSVCAFLGKFHSVDKQPEDRPPSYRISWRRSFLRRIRQSNNLQEIEQLDIIPPPTSNSSRGLPDNYQELQLSASNLQTVDGAALGFMPHTRQTRSLNNLIDPPSYQDVLTAMDETAKRKLKSELCLPSSRF
ncbi:uncharacterized protein LOC123518947 [Portunus trituberculatus]|uniref:uncharacterized protein LOC123518947 n=1 Tax=Portunus trituberculatus TaxID=210409 RepID=UPI001E1CDF89|nr:uncharacterized protein LOC123518947 [Portunus trituberculatus]